LIRAPPGLGITMRPSCCIVPSTALAHPTRFKLHSDISRQFGLFWVEPAYLWGY
jgi:hypothetical protein